MKRGEVWWGDGDTEWPIVLVSGDGDGVHTAMRLAGIE
jgi:hypothetical protein